MKKPFRERIKEGPIVCDGAMGTLLELQGFDELPHEIQNLQNPEIIERLHREYIAVVPRSSSRTPFPATACASPSSGSKASYAR